MQLAFPGLPEPLGQPTKRCPHCLERKALGRFSMDLSRPNGLCRICGTCDAARHRERWRQNAERIRARQRERYAANLIENRKRNAQRRRSEPGKAINRLAVKRYSARNQEKRAAHAAVRRAVLAGVLDRPHRCQLAHLGGCSGRIELHHDDYDQPSTNPRKARPPSHTSMAAPCRPAKTRVKYAANTAVIATG